jgi:hypothetical protein
VFAIHLNPKKLFDIVRLTYKKKLRQNHVAVSYRLFYSANKSKFCFLENIFWFGFFLKDCCSIMLFDCHRQAICLLRQTMFDVNRTKVDGRTNVICPTRALFGSWTVEKQQCFIKSLLIVKTIKEIKFFYIIKSTTFNLWCFLQPLLFRKNVITDC